MNSVSLTGRLTKDPNVSYSSSQLAVARFTLAVDRPMKSKDSSEQTADFISCVCFGKTAELVERYITKGRLVGVTGRIQTGSYEKDGRKIYTTDVVADRVEFLERANSNNSEAGGFQSRAPQSSRSEQLPEGFSALDDGDIPF